MGISKRDPGIIKRINMFYTNSIITMDLRCGPTFLCHTKRSAPRLSGAALLRTIESYVRSFFVSANTKGAFRLVWLYSWRFRCQLLSWSLTGYSGNPILDIICVTTFIALFSKSLANIYQDNFKYIIENIESTIICNPRSNGVLERLGVHCRVNISYMYVLFIF